MVVLAFDTATSATVVGLLHADGRLVQARHDPAPGRRPEHAPRLLPLIHQVLEDGGGWDAVDRLGAGIGPGSFTGLRIGIATARGLAQTRGLPLMGISTLAALARRAARDHPDTVVAVLDARRGEAFAAAWREGTRLLGPAALTPEALTEQVAALPGTVLAAGDGSVRFREQLSAAGAQVPDDDSPLHRVSARALCELTAEAAEAPPGTVLPDYLRLPDAEIAYRKRIDAR